MDLDDALDFFDFGPDTGSSRKKEARAQRSAARAERKARRRAGRRRWYAPWTRHPAVNPR